MSLTFFMRAWRGHERAIVDGYQRVRPLFAEHMRFFRKGDLGTQAKLGKTTLDAPLRLTSESLDGFKLELASADPGVGPYTFQLLLSSRSEKEASAFHLSLPAAWAERPDDACALFHDLAERLPFRFGLAGYATQVDEGSANPNADRACAEWLARFKAVDSMHVIVMQEYARTKIKGVNWLTALDAGLTRDVGGAGKLRRALGEATVHELSKGGVVLRAGSRPLLGDRTKDEDVTAYSKVDAALRTVRLRKGPVLPGFMDEKETAAWLARYE